MLFLGSGGVPLLPSEVCYFLGSGCVNILGDGCGIFWVVGVASFALVGVPHFGLWAGNLTLLQGINTS